MKAALIVPRLVADKAANLQSLLVLGEQAAQKGASLLLYPEAALTGLINNDDPVHDIPLGQTISEGGVKAFAKLCRAHGIWIGLGLLERDATCLYDSAVLIDPAGEIALHYRRIQPQWHGKRANPAVYCQGNALPSAETPFGRLAFLICGDLFDDAIITRMRATEPNLLLVPLARCLPGGAIDQARWDYSELPEYCDRIRLGGVPTLMVNYLADASLGGDGSFGGAWYISAAGDVLASLKVGTQGILYALL